MTELYKFNELNEKSKSRAIKNKINNTNINDFTGEIKDYIFTVLENVIYDQNKLELLQYKNSLKDIYVIDEKIKLEFKNDMVNIKQLFPNTREFEDMIEDRVIRFNGEKLFINLNIIKKCFINNDMLYPTVKTLIKYHNHNIETLETIANELARSYYESLTDEGKIECILEYSEELLYDIDGNLIARNI